MTLQSLNKIRALQDPLKQFQVDLVITNTPGLLLAKLTQQIAGKLSGNTKLLNAEELHLRATSFSYPGAKIGQTELILGGFRRKLGTIQNKSGVWKCKIVEDQEGGVLNIIEAWIDLIHANVLGTRLPSTAYVGTAMLTMGGQASDPRTGKKLGKRTIWLKGFYPIGYSVSEIDQSSSNPVEISVDFNYDWFAGNSYSLLAQFG